jgi:hypothetical protein
MASLVFLVTVVFGVVSSHEETLQAIHETFRVEVHEQALLQVQELEIRDDLRVVDRKHDVNGLEFQ